MYSCFIHPRRLLLPRERFLETGVGRGVHEIVTNPVEGQGGNFLERGLEVGYGVAEVVVMGWLGFIGLDGPFLRLLGRLRLP